MPWMLILLGGVGGLIPDVLRFIRGRYDPSFATYLTNANYIVSLILLAGLGCLAAWLAEATQAREALAYGFGAPEVLSRLLSSPSDRADRDRGGGLLLSLRDWWSL